MKINISKKKKNPKGRGHCHYKVEYRGAAHSICNLKYSVPKKTYKLLIIQNLWQAHYQIFPLIFLKEFIKLNVNDIQKCHTRRNKCKYCDCFFEYKKNSLDNFCLVTKIINRSLMKS